LEWTNLLTALGLAQPIAKRRSFEPKDWFRSFVSFNPAVVSG
jgi:hypothetical protein